MAEMPPGAHGSWAPLQRLARSELQRGCVAAHQGVASITWSLGKLWTFGGQWLSPRCANRDLHAPAGAVEVEPKDCLVAERWWVVLG
jgi:hypothetical protein